MSHEIKKKEIHSQQLGQVQVVKKVVIFIKHSAMKQTCIDIVTNYNTVL